MPGGDVEADGTHQEGYQSLSEDRSTYHAGGFTGPCVARRTPLMDPPDPEPGDGGTGSYRETHVFFVGGMKAGQITPPECAPLELGPARYRVSVIGGDFSWVWRCRDGDPECRIVTREETGEMTEREFEVGVEPGPPPAVAELLTRAIAVRGRHLSTYGDPPTPREGPRRSLPRLAPRG